MDVVEEAAPGVADEVGWAVPPDPWDEWMTDDLLAAWLDPLEADGRASHAAPSAAAAADEIDAFTARLASGPGTSDLLGRLAAVERLRRRLEWYAGELMVAVDAARRAADRAAGVSERLVGSTVAFEVALATRCSPWTASRDPVVRRPDPPRRPRPPARRRWADIAGERGRPVRTVQRRQGAPCVDGARQRPVPRHLTASGRLG